jgi:hypothetical protein
MTQKNTAALAMAGKTRVETKLAATSGAITHISRGASVFAIFFIRATISLKGLYEVKAHQMVRFYFPLHDQEGII